MKRLNKKGFTLAELLIVVAIIAILVAIGIPAFSTAMERSRETVDLSNVRGAYAEFMAGTLGGNANYGYYQLDIKQRTPKDWIIDCTGFLTNVVVKSGSGTNVEFVTPSAMPAVDDGLATGALWVSFWTQNGAEKPSVKFVADTGGMPKTQDNGEANWLTTPYKVTNGTATNGWVSSGDGWYLCKSGL